MHARADRDITLHLLGKPRKWRKATRSHDQNGAAQARTRASHLHHHLDGEGLRDVGATSELHRKARKTDVAIGTTCKLALVVASRSRLPPRTTRSESIGDVGQTWSVSNIIQSIFSSILLGRV